MTNFTTREMQPVPIELLMVANQSIDDTRGLPSPTRYAAGAALGMSFQSIHALMR